MDRQTDRQIVRQRATNIEIDRCMYGWRGRLLSK